jgi:hypothetical protein
MEFVTTYQELFSTVLLRHPDSRQRTLLDHLVKYRPPAQQVVEIGNDVIIKWVV